MNKILITGASSGVGRSLADLFYKKGYELILIARRTEFAKDFTQGKVSAYSVDLAQPEKARDKLSAIFDEHGYIPYVINNAGILKTGKLEEVKWEDFQIAINVNARMPLWIMQRLLPAMKENN